jgi:hypothetical protein
MSSTGTGVSKSTEGEEITLASDPLNDPQTMQAFNALSGPNGDRHTGNTCMTPRRSAMLGIPSSRLRML